MHRKLSASLFVILAVTNALYYGGGQRPQSFAQQGKQPQGREPECRGCVVNINCDGKGCKSTASPVVIHPAQTYSPTKRPPGTYMGSYQPGNYPPGNYLPGKYPPANYALGSYPPGNYPQGNYPSGNYPPGNYPQGNYPQGNYPQGNYPQGNYPLGNYPQGNYPPGSYPQGNYPQGIYKQEQSPYGGGYRLTDLLDSLLPRQFYVGPSSLSIVNERNRTGQKVLR
uniref:Uncharacterized protein n=1 Tax=Setaria digitata TaxID=48799 RepID=A0A915Q0D3_9BILA